MNYVKNYNEYLVEAKTVEDIVKSISRHLAFDDDVIDYLNSPRSKRELGWRDFLKTRLHGKNLDYVTYITKNMVARYNSQITGPVSFNAGGDFDNDETNNVNLDAKLGGEVSGEEIIDRIEDIEDVLGINPEDHETVDRARETLGLNVDEDEDGDSDKDEDD